MRRMNMRGTLTEGGEGVTALRPSERISGQNGGKIPPIARSCVKDGLVAPVFRSARGHPWDSLIADNRVLILLAPVAATASVGVLRKIGGIYQLSRPRNLRLIRYEPAKLSHEKRLLSPSLF